MSIEQLIGKTLIKISDTKEGDTEILFVTTEGEVFRMDHEQDCSESVFVLDIVGHLDDLVGSPILYAEETSNPMDPPPSEGSGTWTFYHIRTMKGTVTIRWYGESNGYYSESVDFALVKGKEVVEVLQKESVLPKLEDPIYRQLLSALGNGEEGVFGVVGDWLEEHGHQRPGNR